MLDFDEEVWEITILMDHRRDPRCDEFSVARCLGYGVNDKY